MTHADKLALHVNLENVAIIAMYCHLRPPDAIAFPIQHFRGFESELQTNPMPFHLESLWGATLTPIRGCAMDWHGTKWLKWGKVRFRL